MMPHLQLSPAVLYEAFAQQRVGYFCGVPDSYVSPFVLHLENHVPAKHTGAANEALAVGLAIGHHIATGTIPLVYMQNSGLNLALDPLTSLTPAGVMRVPMILLIGWRGRPGTHDEPQHALPGAITTQLLDAVNIPHVVLEASTAPHQVALAVQTARQLQTPYALLVEQDLFEPAATSQASSPYILGRETAVQLVAASVGPTGIIVATNGKIGRELFEHRAATGDSHDRDLILVGGMGEASSVAASLARQCPGQQIYCFDGDGSVLMHLGALATIGSLKLANFHHIVFNNGAHDSTGGQATVGHQVDLPAIARACGYTSTSQVDHAGTLAAALAKFTATPGPSLMEIRVSQGARSNLGRPTISPKDNKTAVMNFLDRSRA